MMAETQNKSKASQSVKSMAAVEYEVFLQNHGQSEAFIQKSLSVRSTPY